MPAIQTFDFGPDPWAQITGAAGRGFSEGFTNRYKENQEQGNIENLLASIQPGMGEEDVLKSIIGAKGVPLDQKLKIADEFGKVSKAEKQRQNIDQLSQNARESHGQQEGASVTKSKVTDQDIALARASGNENYAKGLEKQKESEERQFNADREFEWKRAGKVLEQIDSVRDSIPRKEQAIGAIKEAITGKTKFESLGDYLADINPLLEPFRSAKGAQLVAASKEFLLSNISGIGGRPNQWIEQQIAAQIPKAGRSEEANEKVAAMLEAEVTLSKKRVEIADNIEEAYRKSGAIIPGNIGKQIDEAMKPIVEMERSKMAYELKRLDEKHNGLKAVEVTKGTPLTIEMASYLLQKTKGNEADAEKYAKQLGYTIPDQEIYNGYLD